MPQTIPNGTAIILSIETATPGTFVAVGCQGDASFSESQDTIDVSCKDSRATRREAGRYDASVDLEFIYDPDDAAYALIKASVRDGTKVKLLRTEDGTAFEEASFIITKFDTDAPDQDAAKVKISADIDGEWAAAA